jgi:hypothetical protein
MTGVRQALSNLNPSDVRAAAAQPVTIEIGAPSAEAYRDIERALIPDTVATHKRDEARRSLQHADDRRFPATIKIYEVSMAHPAGSFLYHGERPTAVLREVLAAHPELSLALARTFPGFRECVAADVLKSVSRENAMFALATAIPSIVPFLSLPIAVGEFASDAAFLTMNQIRMAFLLAGASGRPIGYREQKAEIGSIIASAFGWRSIARELVGQIPMGGGVLPKAAIAFAGTWVVGASIERVYRLGYGYTPTEREAAYKDALERGKQIAGSILEAYKARKRA